MTIQTKGMAFKRCTQYVDRRFWWLGWADWLWFCGLLHCLASFRKLQDFSKTLMVIFPVLGCFPMYRLTVKSSKENQSKVLSLSTYRDVDMDLSRNVRKQRNGLVWADVVITWHLLETSWETFPAENKEGVFRNTQQWINALCPINTSSKAHVAEQVNTDGDFSSTRDFPDVPFDSESSNESQSEVLSHQDVGNVRKKGTDGCELTLSLLYTYIWHILRKQFQKTFVNKWTSRRELTWSLLDTYIWHILRNNSIGKQTRKCSRTRKYDATIILRFLCYSDFFIGFLTLGPDSSFYKCAILTCRRSVKRISWNKVLLCDKTLPFSKTVLRFLSSVWWESQFTVESRSHVFLKLWSLDRMLIASLQMFDVIKGRLDTQSSRRRWQQ